MAVTIAREAIAGERMAQRSIKLLAVGLALAFLAAGILFEISDDASVNALAAGASEPFMGR